jgi:hypothetical protein
MSLLITVPSVFAAYLGIYIFFSSPNELESELPRKTIEQVAKKDDKTSKETGAEDTVPNHSSTDEKVKSKNQECNLQLVDIHGEEDGQINILLRNLCEEVHYVKGFRLIGKPKFVNLSFYEEPSKIYYWKLESDSEVSKSEFVFNERMNLYQSIPGNTTDRFIVKFDFEKSLTPCSLEYHGAAILFYNENDSLVTPDFYVKI